MGFKIDRLMDENAQLRAEKMLLTSKTMTVSTASVSAFAYMENGNYDQQLRSDELSFIYDEKGMNKFNK